MNYERVLFVVRVLLGALVGMEIAGSMGAFPTFDDRVWPGLLFMSIASWAVLEGIDRWMRMRTLARLPALVVLVGLAVVYLDAVGNIAGWYASLQRFDVVVHAASGLAVTAVLFYVVRDVARKYGMNSGPKVWGYIAWTTMVTLAILFEVGEWMADIVFQISFWLGSAQDTLGDLLAAMIGGAATLFIIWLARRFRE